MSTTTHSLVIALLPAIGKGSKEPPAAGRFRSRRAALLVLVSGLCCMIEIASAASHRFVDLGTLGGATSYGFGLNEVGQVVGRGYRPFGVPYGYQPTLWSGGTATDLGTLTGENGVGIARDINNRGVVVGDFSVHPGAVVWDGANVSYLSSPRGTWTYALAINDAGKVVGLAGSLYGSGLESARAMLWNGGVATELSTLGGARSGAEDINEAGQIAGWSQVAGSTAYHATLWNGNSVADLGANSAAYGINESGQVVGYSLNGGTRPAATLWEGGTATVLDKVPGSRSSEALDINAAGLIVGYMRGLSGQHAVLWRGGTGIELNDVLDATTVNAGWVLTEATAINDRGWITGTAFNSITGYSHAYLLTTVPEPSTPALLLAGLFVVGCWTRRGIASLVTRN